MSFDILTLVGPNDSNLIKKQIEYTKTNVIGHRNIYLICYDPNIQINGCITINENIFPFTIDTVIKLHGKLDRNAWYLQQLIKLYAGFLIPGILDRYLVIDADTFFLKPTTFIENNICLYNFGNEYNKPYFEHISRLDIGLNKADETKSGICHHMMFETKYINDIKTKVETRHNDAFYNVFLNSVSDSDKNGSGASEYEIYFNYIMKYHSDKIKIRELKWENAFTFDENANLDYISCHWYSRRFHFTN